MSNQELETTTESPNQIDVLLHIWAQQHHPTPLPGRVEKEYCSISELMVFLNNSANRQDPESHFDAAYVLEKIQISGYETMVMGGVVHMVVY